MGVSSVLTFEGTLKRFNSTQKVGQDGVNHQEVQLVLVGQVNDVGIARLAQLQRDGLMWVGLKTVQPALPGIGEASNGDPQMSIPGLVGDEEEGVV